jgi:thiol:disulfide interchange protein DsbC
MIVFSPASPKHTITVFTDIDCTYCRRLHNEVKQLNDLGVKVRYMAFPRAGAGSEPFSKAVSVWCAEDRQQAITDAKAGQPVPTKNCANPVQAQYEVGQTIGVRGTPAIILENGRMLPGYVPAPELVQQLDEDKTPLP